jgi:peptide/nickel transport system permease protein
MARFIVRRSLQALVVLFLVSIFTFLIFQVIPNGNPAERLAGRTATPEEVADVARAWGFNRPVVVQYATMMRSEPHLAFLGDRNRAVERAETRWDS